jgi:hypothetical protein
MQTSAQPHSHAAQFAAMIPAAAAHPAFRA